MNKIARETLGVTHNKESELFFCAASKYTLYLFYFLPCPYLTLTFAHRKYAILVYTDHYPRIIKILRLVRVLLPVYG